MKPLLQSVGLVIVLALTVVAFLFFKTWRDAPLPELLEAQWAESSVTLGDVSELNIEAKVPWTCRIDKTPRPKAPEGFVVARQQAEPVQSRPNLSGFRQLSLTLDLVPMAARSGEAGAVQLHLPTRSGTTPLLVDLPPLEVHGLETTSTALIRPGAWDGPPKPAAYTPETTSFPWRTALLAALLVLGLLLGILLFLKHRRHHVQRSQVDAWKQALEKLTGLSQQHSLGDAPFFAQLTDILKGYLANRFERPAAHAATTLELHAFVGNHTELPAELKVAILCVGRTADQAKFSRRPVDRTFRASAIEVVRSAVEATRPAEPESEEIAHV